VALACAVALRLVLMPLVGAALAALFVAVLPEPDPLMLWLGALTFAAPTNISVLLIAQLTGNTAIKELGAVVLWLYVVSLVLTPLWASLYLYIVL